jgi:mono/diheme cytochrome c family protein
MSSSLPRFGRRHWVITSVASAGAAAAAVLAAVFVYTGIYNIAADAPHTSAVFWLLQTTRNHSIAARAGEVGPPPDLTDGERIAAGAELYADMCGGCHLAPGMEPTEISQGLYPRAPDLTKGSALTPAEKFWVIKHGIKMTGMAAWGPTHSDALIWDMVAFLEKLPSLDAVQYQSLIKNASEDHDHVMHDMPGMSFDGSDTHHY